jgi:hypothetical protein
MRTGFAPKYPRMFSSKYRKSYTREDQGIKIPDEDLEELGLIPYSLFTIFTSEVVNEFHPKPDPFVPEVP